MQFFDKLAEIVTTLQEGIEALKQWRYKWDEDRKEFSKEPEHDWASHSADAFGCGCIAYEEPKTPEPEKANAYHGAGGWMG